MTKPLARMCLRVHLYLANPCHNQEYHSQFIGAKKSGLIQQTLLFSQLTLTNALIGLLHTNTLFYKTLWGKKRGQSCLKLRKQ